MDSTNLNSSNLNQGTPPSGAAPVNPAPNLDPKVFDLSSINSVNKGNNGGSFFKKKTFIVGVLSVLVLAVLVAAGSYVFINQNANPTGKASEADCLTINGNGSNSAGSTATITVSITNNCQTPVNVKFKKEWHWCPDARTNSRGEHTCQANGTSEWESGDHDVAPGQTSDSVSTSQAIGNTGNCGSAQVDIWYKTPSGAPTFAAAGVAWSDTECTTIITPSPTPSPSVTPPVVTPSPTPTVTPPVTPTPTVTQPVTPTPTPSVPPSYRVCENEACITKDGVGTSTCGINADCKKTKHMACVNNSCIQVEGGGADSCTSDASCQPAAVPPPIPESGSTGLTLIGIVTGLAALGAALFLAL